MKKGPIVFIADSRCAKLYSSLSFEDERVEVYSLEDAPCLIRECRADLVLIDCGVEPEEGIKTLRKFKAAHPGIPVLFLSDLGSEELAWRAVASGARDFLQNSVDLLELKEMVKTLLLLKRSAKERRVLFEPRGRSRQRALPVVVSTGTPYCLLQAIRYIEENLDRKISLAECARAASLSRHHFCRKFKKYFGMGPMRFVAFLRIERAKRLLPNEHLNITEIAHRVGFGDASVFSLRFRKFTGLSPTEFRRSVRGKG